ncbi:S-adenosyl-L-methionine-dependent methyltransferase [Aspergillus steynii IBT 23096]|uniref:S-adenosyl-L-methionine-dependent methyltransferase n=1 Tax=Aspergillus steynii IBT 23096 TaxID=1392250 RepID=A0A2I2GKQ4_9EURO|nr:S-adenosyl-L-methionine-dependent methyltransferase [Aspergillus steynii IBT 23096]PLB53461.1 S-adenosyl-L-methionine-dependent methyltransferase [Aspergillus steynii IBT 23096]
MSAITVPDDAWSQGLPALKDSIQIHLTESETKFEEAMVHAAFHFVVDSVQQLKHDDRDDWEWHRRVMYDWMLETIELGNGGAIAPGSEAWAKESPQVRSGLVEYLEATENVSARLTVRVGQNLVKIFRDEMTPLELVMEDNLLNRYYMEYPKLKDRSYKHLRRAVELYARARPDARILEIGAGTGGATKIVLQSFDTVIEEQDEDRYPEYTFTDISAGFFLAAKSKLAAWAPDMDFQKLDIESNPQDQGFEPGQYDLVVASLVLHATKSLHRTLTHVRQLLKPGGKLFLVETTRDVTDMQLIFGLFEGWWLSEDNRKSSPNAPTHVWDRVMRETGFTGVDFEIGDCEEAIYQSTSLLVTTASLV